MEEVEIRELVVLVAEQSLIKEVVQEELEMLVELLILILHQVVGVMMVGQVETVVHGQVVEAEELLVMEVQQDLVLEDLEVVD